MLVTSLMLVTIHHVNHKPLMLVTIHHVSHYFYLKSCCKALVTDRRNGKALVTDRRNGKAHVTDRRTEWTNGHIGQTY